MDYEYTKAKGLPFGAIADVDELVSGGYSAVEAAEIVEDYTVWLQGKEQRSIVRREIESRAGDTLSMLGTTADAAALATLGISALTVSLAGAGNYTDFKKAFLDALGKLAGGQDMVAVSAAFLQKVEAGEVIIPAMAKGMGEVIADIEERSTAVSMALIAAKSG